MAWMDFRAKILPIGIDLGSTEVKAAQLRKTGRGVELFAAGAESAPRDGTPKPLDSLADKIRSILKAGPFRGRRCVLSLPAETIFLHHVRLPKLPPRQTVQSLRLELDGKLPDGMKDAVIRSVIAHEVAVDNNIQNEMIVIAVARDVMNAYLDMAKRAKLDVVGVNIESFAIVECFSHLLRRASDSARSILFVDMGHSSTQAAISHGNKVVFARNLQIGGEQFDQAVADGLSLSTDEAHALRCNPQRGQNDAAIDEQIYGLLQKGLDDMAGELRKCLSYYESVFKNRRIDLAIFVGGQAYDRRLCQSLAQRLNLPAKIGNPLLCVSLAQGAGRNTSLDGSGPHPGWAVAIGLSLGATAA